jgi:glutathione S-transferase
MKVESGTICPSSPKGKFPYLDDDGQIVPDSTFIRFYLEKKYDIDYNAGLSPEQSGCAWAIEKMLEDHVYWAAMTERWLDPKNFAIGPAHIFDGFPALIRPIVRSMVLRQIRRSAYGQGMGRHTKDEQILLVNKAITATAQVLGDRRYLMGEQPCGADATAYAFASSALCKIFDSRIRGEVEKHSNIVAYVERMEKQYFPEGIAS